MTEQPTPAARFMSFGAGVQSITQALLIQDGVLERPDAAIFSDTGWEPQGVYDMLDRVEREIFQPLGVPLYRVNNGVIQDDVLNPNKMRGIPGFTASKPYEVEVVDRWGICPDETCGWRKLRQVKIDSVDEVEGMSLFTVVTTDLSDMAGLFDSIVMVPKQATLRQLETQGAYWTPDESAADDSDVEVNPALQVAEALRRAGLRRLPDEHMACRSTGVIATASHTEIRRDYGMLNRKCTQTYKLQPILEQVRLLLGGAVGEEKICRYCEGKGERVAPWRAKRGETEIAECSVCEGTGTISRVGQPPPACGLSSGSGFLPTRSAAFPTAATPGTASLATRSSNSTCPASSASTTSTPVGGATSLSPPAWAARSSRMPSGGVSATPTPRGGPRPLRSTRRTGTPPA